jgi:hypothetical protein
MKLGLISLGLIVLVGCSHSLPPEPPYVETVTKHRLPLPRVKGQTVEDPTPPVKTWLSKEEVEQQRLKEAIEKAAAEDPCRAGDPLCPHIRTTP